jgi:hypothetical protein
MNNNHMVKITISVTRRDTPNTFLYRNVTTLKECVHYDNAMRMADRAKKLILAIASLLK